MGPCQHTCAGEGEGVGGTEREGRGVGTGEGRDEGGGPRRVAFCAVLHSGLRSVSSEEPAWS